MLVIRTSSGRENAEASNSAIPFVLNECVVSTHQRDVNSDCVAYSSPDAIPTYGYGEQEEYNALNRLRQVCLSNHGTAVEGLNRCNVFDEA